MGAINGPMDGIAALPKIIQPVKSKINSIQPSKTFLNPSYSPLETEIHD